MLPARVILHPTDFSHCSSFAFQVAGTLAREQGTLLVVLHVQQPFLRLAAYAEGLARMQPHEYTEWLWKLLRRFEVPEAKGGVEYRLEEGEPSREILRVAAEIDCGLIVMGSHGRTDLERLILGSVAEQVLRRARCPVLTLKTPRLVTFGSHAAAAWTQPTAAASRTGATGA